jgi:hypothetical protein
VPVGADSNLLNYRVRLRLQRIGRFQRFTGSVAGRRPIYVLDEFPHDLTEANARLRIRDMQRRRGPPLAFLPDDSIDSPFPAGNALANVGRAVMRTADRIEGHLSASAVSHFMGVMKQEPNYAWIGGQTGMCPRPDVGFEEISPKPVSGQLPDCQPSGNQFRG